ncbi:phospholipase D-like domain-containing protein [Thiomicrorhabdus cannonii]|uniref:phospholipase D-like domain-containing protein n=1 Tax=Thiomicrorhabdus cannonii TaxID=2748011 RepID=UPI0015C007C7|nr:phospholipase D-like domain-containing protein [Thiomicrorhabdus cannonii]
MALNKIAIFLRKNWTINRFRDAIITTFESPDVSEMILCSGFFQENKHYMASNDFKNICGKNKKTLKVVGLYSYNWRGDFDAFCQGVVNNNCPACLTVKKFRVPGMKWHAKIMVGKKNNQPVIASIGSSNITRRAFGKNMNFNYESDVIIWDDSINSISERLNELFQASLDQSDEVVISEYDPEDWRNGNLTLVEKVKKLEQDIFENAQLEE